MQLHVFAIDTCPRIKPFSEAKVINKKIVLQNNETLNFSHTAFHIFLGTSSRGGIQGETH
jgi:hypothetical protein